MISRSRKPGRFRLGRFLPDQHKALRGDGVMAQWRGRITFRRVAVIFVFVALAMAPDFLGLRTVSQRVGSLPTQSIYSRQDFHWVTREKREEIVTGVRARFARYYVEPADWVAQITQRAQTILNNAMLPDHAAMMSDSKRANALEDLRAIALEQGVSLSATDVEALLDGLQGIRRSRTTLEEALFAPTRTVLTAPIAAIGVMSESDFQEETGRSIRIKRSSGEVHLIPRVGDPGNIMPVGKVAFELEHALAGLLKGLSPTFLQAWVRIIERDMKPNLSFDSERNRLEIEESIRREIELESLIRENTLIAKAGQYVDANTFDQIMAEAKAHEAGNKNKVYFFDLIGKALLLLAAGVGFLVYGFRFEQPGVSRRSRMVLLTVMAVVLLTVLRVCMAMGMTVSLMPMGLIAGLAALVFGPRMGVACASLFCFSTFILTGADVGEFVALLGSSWLFSTLTPGVRFRLGLVRAGLASGVVAFLFLGCWDLSGAAGLDTGLLTRAGFNALWWLGGGIVVTMLLPFIEHAFGCATNVSLLELSDQNHPCLRRLILEAPGTYHHSVVVGNLAEAAAEALGANALLARVGSYYHDIGKILKPDYFTENDSGQSRHEMLTPTMSTLVILAHVKDGVELGKLYNLPQNVIDIIRQHHGTSLVQYFYQRAKELSNGASVDEGAFRYEGPNPQDRESAIVCLADSVEAASRSLTEPSPAHIEKLVHRIVMGKMMDHQLDESQLTFRDVARVEKSFCRTLNAMYHTRIRYPDGDRKGRS